MNPMPVLTDKVLLALELYPVPVLLPLVSSCETGEPLQTTKSRCDDVPLGCTRCSLRCTRDGLLSSEVARYLLVVLEDGKETLM